MGLRIVLADDHELVRQGMIRILAESHPEWEIVGEAPSGAEALRLCAQEQPDLAILDLTMPDLSGLDVAAQLAASAPATRVLILTMHAAAPILKQLRKAGVSAYLVKSEAPKKLVEAVERVVAGEPFFASEAGYRAPGEVESPEYIPCQFLLTPRELSVMRLLAQGKGNKEIADELKLSVRTAESHRASVLEKLGVESVADIVLLASRDRVI